MSRHGAAWPGHGTASVAHDAARLGRTARRLGPLATRHDFRRAPGHGGGPLGWSRGAPRAARRAADPPGALADRHRASRAPDPGASRPQPARVPPARKPVRAGPAGTLRGAARHLRDRRGGWPALPSPLARLLSRAVGDRQRPVRSTPGRAVDRVGSTAPAVGGARARARRRTLLRQAADRIAPRRAGLRRLRCPSRRGPVAGGAPARSCLRRPGHVPATPRGPRPSHPWACTEAAGARRPRRLG